MAPGDLNAKLHEYSIEFQCAGSEQALIQYLADHAIPRLHARAAEDGVKLLPTVDVGLHMDRTALDEQETDTRTYTAKARGYRVDFEAGAWRDGKDHDD